MATGKVKWFNNAKGYGFILPEGGGEDLFVHYSSIQMEGYKTLKAGQDVDFDVLAGPKGHHAVNIRTSDSDGIADDAEEEPDAALDAGQESRAEEPEETLDSSTVRNGSSETTS